MKKKTHARGGSEQQDEILRQKMYEMTVMEVKPRNFRSQWLRRQEAMSRPLPLGSLELVLAARKKNTGHNGK